MTRPLISLAALLALAAPSFAQEAAPAPPSPAETHAPGANAANGYSALLADLNLELQRPTGDEIPGPPGASFADDDELELDEPVPLYGSVKGSSSRVRDESAWS